MQAKGFKSSRADLDIWKHQNDGICKYNAVYVDDLVFAIKKPKLFVEKFQTKHRFRVKGTGPLEFHLRENVEKYSYGTLCMSQNNTSSIN